MEPPFCLEHSGCITRIAEMERRMKNEEEKTDKLIAKMNQLLGGLILMPVLASILVVALQYWLS